MCGVTGLRENSNVGRAGLILTVTWMYGFDFDSSSYSPLTQHKNSGCSVIKNKNKVTSSS